MHIELWLEALWRASCRSVFNGASGTLKGRQEMTVLNVSSQVVKLANVDCPDGELS